MRERNALSVDFIVGAFLRLIREALALAEVLKRLTVLTVLCAVLGLVVSNSREPSAITSPSPIPRGLPNEQLPPVINNISFISINNPSSLHDTLHAFHLN